MWLEWTLTWQPSHFLYENVDGGKNCSLLLTLWQPFLKFSSLGALGFISFLAPVQGSDTSSQKIYHIQSPHPIAQRIKLLGDSICGFFPKLTQLLNPFSWSSWLCLSPDFNISLGMAWTVAWDAHYYPSGINKCFSMSSLHRLPHHWSCPLHPHCTWSYWLHVSTLILTPGTA